MPKTSFQSSEQQVNTSEIKTVIITGLAGSGKSTALAALEDIGYYAIDNLPVFLLKELLTQAEEGKLRNDKLALVMDCRDPLLLTSFETTLSQIKPKDLHILFLDADVAVLLRRFSQLRRNHPLAANCSIRDAILREKEALQPIRKIASIVDTSQLSPHDLGRQLRKIFGQSDKEKLTVNLLSFGFKHGPPPESESLWDVRFLPNPYFVPELKSRTGLEKDVAGYVLDNEISRYFFKLLEPMLFFLIPKYQEEGKVQLTISIGCTGGKHRSVAVTEKIRELLSRQSVNLIVEHRDIDKS